MAWVNDRESAYIDHWDSEVNGRRWYRRLDRDNAGYLYRYEQMQPAQSVLFGPADAVGLPGGMADAGFLIADDTGQALYQTALTLAADLAGVVTEAGQRIAGLGDAAARVAGTVSDALGEAAARPEQVKDDQTAAERNRLIRQGLRYLMDAAAQANIWVTSTAAVTAPYRNRIRSVAARINAITTPLYNALL